MGLSIDPHGALSTVYASGEIDAVTCGDLEDTLSRLMGGGETRIVLDLSATVYISSAGLRVILGAAERLHGVGKFVISAVNPDVREILEMAGFANIIDIYDSTEKAVAAVFEERAPFPPRRP
jgi:anti-anti-sigma factor